MTKDERIKQEITNSARKLILRYGIQRITMEDIAKDAGKGKSTLYYYFKSKDEIANIVIYEEAKAIIELVRKEVEKKETATEKLKTYSIKSLEEMRNRSLIHDALFGELKEDPRIVLKIKQVFTNQQVELVQCILELGIETGEFRELGDLSINDLAFTIVSCVKGLELSFFESSRMAELVDNFDRVLDVLIIGLRK